MNCRCLIQGNMTACQMRLRIILIFSWHMKWSCCVHLLSGSCIGSKGLLMTPI